MEQVNFLRTANFKLGNDKPSYLTQAKLQQLGDQGQAQRFLKNEQRSISSGHGSYRPNLIGNHLKQNSVDDSRSVGSVGAFSMRGRQVEPDGKTCIGPILTHTQEAKKISGTMKSLNWGYSHSRASDRAPGVQETSGSNIGDKNQIIRDQNRDKIKE